MILSGFADYGHEALEAIFMINALETKTVFIDTQTFIEANFQFMDGKLAHVARLGRSGHIKILTTSIIIREVENRIREAVRAAFKLVAEVRDKGYVLRNIKTPSFSVVFDPSIKKNDLIGQVIDSFHEFLKNSHVTIIDIDKVSVNDIFDRYFELRPPFKEGDKKAEFPDAFNIAALSDWSKQNMQSVYIISGDSDLARACQENKNLILISKITQFLSILEEDNKRTENLEIIFERNIVDVKDKIKNKFEELNFWIEDERGDTSDIDVISVDIVERYITDIDNNEVVFSITCRVKFSAHVAYDDPDSIIYDKEDNVYMVLDIIKEDIEVEEEIEVEVFFKMKPQDSEPKTIRVVLDISDVYISV